VEVPRFGCSPCQMSLSELNCKVCTDCGQIDFVQLWHINYAIFKQLWVSGSVRFASVRFGSSGPDVPDPWDNTEITCDTWNSKKINTYNFALMKFTLQRQNFERAAGSKWLLAWKGILGQARPGQGRIMSTHTTSRG